MDHRLAFVPTPTELVPYLGDHFVARRKVFKLFGAAFHVYGADGGVRMFVKQKAFKLKEAITVFADETARTPLLFIQARRILDISAAYDVTTAAGEKVGVLRRKGLKSMLRDEWLILDVNDVEIGKIEEDSLFMALLRRLLTNLVPQTFNLTIRGAPVAVFRQRFNPFVHKFDLDFTPDAEGVLDRRLGMAAAVLLLAIEGRQQ